ncbi:MAG: SxtJ family membrane protein [Actinomycetota bacterium]|jgi:hypothetical protein|nr:SxtJ family membrane protein [Actinomycetota bacterium]
MASINRHPSRKDLLVFGLLLPPFVAVLGVAVHHWTGSPVAAAIAWAAGGVFSLVYLAVPAARRPLFVGWNRATFPIGWAVSHAVMAVVYFGVVTPTALIVRVLDRDPLDQRADPSAPSYWVPRERTSTEERYFRPY